MPFATMAQFAVNPQLCITMQKLTDAPEGAEYMAALGAMIGFGYAHWRTDSTSNFGGFFGAQQYRGERGRQPGGRGQPRAQQLEIESAGRVQPLIDGDGFRLRFNTGPTYDVLLSVDTRMTRSNGTRDDSTPVPSIGTLGSRADITIITLETGMTYGAEQGVQGAG
ncbi:MAG: hypothetical protein IPN38_13595 [Flavobacteriales bacterium]|nr:hypothetical protein [Flavobacteriales bacterium]